MNQFQTLHFDAMYAKIWQYLETKHDISVLDIY